MVKYDLWGKTVDLELDPEHFPSPDDLAEMDRICGGTEHGWFTSATGLDIHYRKFVPTTTTKPQAALLFVHGIMGHSGLAFELKDGRFTSMGLISRMALQKDVVVYAIDLSGHGFSGGKRFYVPGFREQRDEVIQLMQIMANDFPELPLFVLGISYGGALAVHTGYHLQQNPSLVPNFQGLLLACPALDAEIPPFPIKFTLRYILAPLFPTWTPFFMPHPVTPDRTWSQPEVQKLFVGESQAPRGLAKCGTPFCLGTGVSLLDSLEVAQAEALPNLKIPFCVAHGTSDYAVFPSGTDLLWKSCQTPEKDRSLQMVEGAYHDLIAEPTAESTMEFLLGWMMSRLD